MTRPRENQEEDSPAWLILTQAHTHHLPPQRLARHSHALPHQVPGTPTARATAVTRANERDQARPGQPSGPTSTQYAREPLDEPLTMLTTCSLPTPPRVLGSVLEQGDHGHWGATHKDGRVGSA